MKYDALIDADGFLIYAVPIGTKKGWSDLDLTVGRAVQLDLSDRELNDWSLGKVRCVGTKLQPNLSWLPDPGLGDDY